MLHLRIDAEEIGKKFASEVKGIEKDALKHLGLLQSIDSKKHMDSEGNIAYLVNYAHKTGSSLQYVQYRFRAISDRRIQAILSDFTPDESIKHNPHVALLRI